MRAFFYLHYGYIALPPNILYLVKLNQPKKQMSVLNNELLRADATELTADRLKLRAQNAKSKRKARANPVKRASEKVKDAERKRLKLSNMSKEQFLLQKEDKIEKQKQRRNNATEEEKSIKRARERELYAAKKKRVQLEKGMFITAFHILIY